MFYLLRSDFCLVEFLFFVKFWFPVKFLLFQSAIKLLSLWVLRGLCVCASKMEPQPGPSREKVFLSPRKKRRKTAMNVSEKTMVMNCYKYVYNNWPEDQYWTLADCANKAAEILGISQTTVRRVVKEHKDHKQFTSPKKTGPKSSVLDKIDEFDLVAIRRLVHQFFHRNEAPTIQKILQVVNDTPNLPNLSARSLRLILKHLNFKYASRKRRSCLIDRSDIRDWRKQYLMKIKQYRQEGRPIYYQDETWINEGHTLSKVWQDTQVQSSRQAFLEGLSTGLRAPTGKGRRLIISHIGSEEGFLEGGLLLFESKKNTEDYHQEMNSQHFEEWLTSILPKLKTNAILVIDNAPYHSRKLELGPTHKWKKAQIVDWLKEKNINHEAKMTKKDLMGIVTKEKATHDKYAVDELAANVQILRLPPYHCELNPIELVWAQVKGYVAKNNKTFKMAEVRSLFDEGLQEVTPQRWQACIGHVIQIEDEMCKLDGLITGTVQTLIINVTESDSDISCSDISDGDSDE